MLVIVVCVFVRKVHVTGAETLAPTMADSNTNQEIGLQTTSAVFLPAIAVPSIRARTHTHTHATDTFWS